MTSNDDLESLVSDSSAPSTDIKDLVVLLRHSPITIAKLLGPGGSRAVVADSLLMKQQLMAIHRSRQILGFEVHAGEIDDMALC